MVYISVPESHGLKAQGGKKHLLLGESFKKVLTNFLWSLKNIVTTLSKIIFIFLWS